MNSPTAFGIKKSTAIQRYLYTKNTQSEPKWGHFSDKVDMQMHIGLHLRLNIDCTLCLTSSLQMDYNDTSDTVHHRCSSTLFQGYYAIPGCAVCLTERLGGGGVVGGGGKRENVIKSI